MTKTRYISHPRHLYAFFHWNTGAFSRFLPTLPYPFVGGGDNSPPISTHSPPAAIAMTNIGNGNRIPLSARDSRDSIDYMNIPTVVRPQPQLPSSATIAAGTHLTNGTTTTLSPLRIRVSSPNRINSSDLTSVSEKNHNCIHLIQEKRKSLIWKTFNWIDGMKQNSKIKLH